MHWIFKKKYKLIQQFSPIIIKMKAGKIQWYLKNRTLQKYSTKNEYWREMEEYHCIAVIEFLEKGWIDIEAAKSW